MPFKKGQSGNPAGRPKGLRDRRAALRYKLTRQLPDILKTLADGRQGWGYPGREAHPRTHLAAAQECR